MALPSFLARHQPRASNQRSFEPADPRGLGLPSGTATQLFARAVGAVEGPDAEFALPHVLQFSGIIAGAWRTYYHGQYDEAMRFSQEDALAMRNDAWLMSLLDERKRAVATLKWHVEVDNPRDPVQKALADGLTQLYKNLPNYTDLTMSGLEAIWFGRAGDQFVYRYKNVQVPAMPRMASAPGVPASLVASEGEYETRRVLSMIRHQPVEGDKIGYDLDGTPYFLVSPIVALNTYKEYPGADLRTLTKDGWKSDDYQQPPAPMVPDLNARHASLGFTTIGGKALFLKGNWRSRARIHKHMVLDSSYWQPWKADSIHGVGIRSVIFWYWWLRQEYLANVTDWAARTGLGIKLWYYEQGNNQSKQAILKAAKESDDKVNIAVPYDPNQPNRPAVDIVEMSGSGADLLLTIVKHVEEYCERYIVGQNMTGGSDDFSAGFGDKGRSELASRTNWQITKLDARKFDDTNTTDVLDVIKRFSYPEYADMPARLVSDVDDPDIKKWSEGAKTFVDMGGEIVEDEARAKLGLSRPRGTDKTIGGAQALQAKQATSGHVKPPDGMGPDGANGEPANGTPETPDNSMFRLAADERPVRYAEPKAKKEPKWETQDGQKGRWVTMGAVNGHGGSHVFISEKGAILKGNPRLMGHSIRQGGLSFGPQGGHHPEMESAAQVQGLNPQDLHSLADEYLTHDQENKQDVMTMLREAKRRLPGIMRADPAGDYSGIPAFDTTARTLSTEYPHLFKGGWSMDQPEGQDADYDAMLWDYIQAARSGEYRPMTHQEAYDQALGTLLENKALAAQEAAEGSADESGGSGDVGTFDPAEFDMDAPAPAQQPVSPTAAAAQPATPAISPEDLVAKHFPMVGELSAQMAGKYGFHQDDLESPAQEAFLNAARTYEPADGDFKAYAKVVMANAMKNAMRKESKTRGSLKSGAQSLATKEGANIDPATRTADPRMAEVDDAIASLPDESRQLMEHVKAGRGPKELAAALGISANAAALRTHRVMKQLKDLIPHSFAAIAHWFDELWRYMEETADRYEYGPRRHPEASVKGAVVRLQALREHKIDGEALDAEMNSIAREFTADELKEIARKCGVDGGVGTKSQAVEKLAAWIRAGEDQKAMYDYYRTMIEGML